MAYPTHMDDLGVWIPHGWGQTWRRALKNASSVPAIVNVVGASIAEGYNSTDRPRLGWVGLLEDALHGRWGHGGSGYAGVAGAPHGSLFGPFPLLEDGAWAHDPGVTLAGSSWTPGTPAAWIEWPDVEGEDLVFFYSPAPSLGHSDVFVDDVYVGRFSMAQSGPAPAWMPLGRFSSGKHSVRIEGTQRLLQGVWGGNDRGVRVNRLVHWGWSARDLQDPAWSGASVPPDTMAEWTIKRFQGMADDQAAGLLIYTLGTNDWFRDESVSAFGNFMRAHLNRARGLNPNIDILVVINHPGNGTFDDPGTYGPYAEMMHLVAGEFGAAVVDLWARSGFEPDIGGLLDDGIHPTDQGHAWYAESIISAVCDFCDDKRPTARPITPAATSWLALDGLGAAFTDGVMDVDWGDVDVRFYGAATDWTPSNRMDVVSVWQPASDRSWQVSVMPDQTLRWAKSVDGVSTASVQSTAPLYAPGDGYGAKGRVVASVAGAPNVSFYEAPEWREIGTPQTLASGQPPWAAPDGPLLVGHGGALTNFIGKIYAVEVWNDGELVACPDFTRVPPGTTSFYDDCGNLWEMFANAVIQGPV